MKEVAEVVGASVSAVKVRAHRGYERLRVLLIAEAPPSARTASGDASAAGPGIAGEMPRNQPDAVGIPGSDA